MKRLVFLTVACVTLLLATGVSSFLASSYVHAGPTSSSRIQMFSGTFIDQNIPADGQPHILVTIPFSITATGKLEATSLINGSGAGVPITCELDLDHVAFFSNTENYLGNTSFVGASGVAKPVSAGSHTFTVACTDNNQQYPSLLHSMGTSVIVTG